MIKKILYFILGFSYLLYGRGNTERAGDVLLFLIPSIAYGSTLYYGNSEDQMEFYQSYGSTILTTVILKKSVREQRPNNSSSYESFPSGHTSSAFSGATFIHKKYGLEYAIPAYLAAVYTGYSRVHAKRHYIHDVLAGALLGSGLTWYFTRNKKEPHLSASVEDEAYVFKWNYSF